MCILEKKTKKNKKSKKYLQKYSKQCILTTAVTLIAMKREVAAVWKQTVGFPWSECQVRKLATSHCTKISPPESGNAVM